MQKHITQGIILMSCILVFLGGCTTRSDYDQMQARLQRQDQQLSQMQPNMADSWAETQKMRKELTVLRAQMAELNAAGGTRGVINRLNKHNAALRQVEQKLSLDFNLDGPIGYTTAAPPQTSGLDPAPPRPPMTSTAPPQSADPAAQLFNEGVKAFNSRNYASAQSSFVNFTRQYPSNSQVGNAWFYIGEANFQQNKFNEAAVAYEKVISTHSRSARAPSAYLKQAISFSKLGNKAAAVARMQELMKKYPTSAEAARAKAFLQTNQ